MCEKCQDRGFILVNQNGLDVAKDCECKPLLEFERRCKVSGISRAFQEKTFANYDVGENQARIVARDVALQYCGAFPEIKDTMNNSFMIQGQVGSGKTHLSIAIAMNIMKIHHTGVVYMPYTESLLRIKQNAMDRINYANEINKYKNAPVLLIDDLLKGGATAADLKALFEIVNYRYLEHKPIIVSTEKSDDDLLDIDEATMSRIIEMCRGHHVTMRGRELNYRLYCA